MIDPGFWKDRRVLLTGHTGFKGAWMALLLEQMGARVSGFALAPEGEPNLFTLMSPWPALQSTLADIADPAAIGRAMAEADPEIVIHMAAQALVRRSYREPAATVATNVMGTVNLLEALRAAKSLRVALVVTSDKVYRNTDDGIAFGEGDALGGDDPYSASKAAQEIVTAAWARSFFAEGPVVATARAGNVVGGGDFSEDRLIPDLYRAITRRTGLELRNPDATRPWQHVLDLADGYLTYVQQLATRPDAVPRCLNFGPDPGPAWTVRAIADAMMAAMGIDVPVAIRPSPMKEKALLAVNASAARKVLDWRPRLDTDATVKLTAAWYGGLIKGGDPRVLSSDQIAEYRELP